MPQFNVTVNCPVFESFRVAQVAGLFDVPLAEKASASFSVEVPGADETWEIGLVVGPSGSGKSSVARAAFGPHLYQGGDWPADRAVVDCFGELSAREVTGLLTAVGFSSPPSWIKPYQVLSGGERFRCDLARALARGEGRGVRDERRQVSGERRDGTNVSDLQPTAYSPQPVPIVAFDEFTSVVDRNVAQVGSAAIAKAIRSGAIPCRFVAVTCHYDVAEWLEPDWVVDMASGACQRRRLRRPAIALELFRCRRRAWTPFARHHYLSGALNPAARCYLALWKGSAVAFCAVLPLIGRKNHWRISRIVTLPDYQGIGIGMRMAEAVADLYLRQGSRMNITASHPAVVSHCKRSPLWRGVRVLKTGSRRGRGFSRSYRGSPGRTVASFEYVGPPDNAREA